MMPRLLILISAFVTILVAPRLAQACSCGGGTPPTFQAYEGAEAVFVAVATGRTPIVSSTIHPDGSRSLGLDSSHSADVALRIEETFKGMTDHSVLVAEGSCSFIFEEGKRYLVYALRDEAGLIVPRVCARTRLLSSAASDLEWLRAGAGNRATIYGQLLRRRESDAQLVLPPITTRVLLQGPDKTREVLIGPGDGFEFNNLPDGSYTISVENAAIDQISIEAPGIAERLAGVQVTVRQQNPIQLQVIARF